MKSDRLIRTQINANYLLSSLNGERDFGAEKLAWAEGSIKARRLNDGSWLGLFAAPEADYRKASEVFVSELRKLTDEWLDSGRSGGIEEPKIRTLENSPTAYHAVDCWLEENNPLLRADPSGSVAYLFGGQKLPTQGEDQPVQDAIDEARRVFVLFMNSPIKWALFKCCEPECERYYILEKPHKVYKRGAYCTEHRRRASAIRVTKQRRDQKQEEALKIAVKAFLAWQEPSNHLPDGQKVLKPYIADKLRDSGFGVNWVSRHLSEIEKRAKEDDHAES